MGESPRKVRSVGESIKQTLVLALDAREQGVSWGLITPLHMPSLLPHDLCHGRSSSHWPPAYIFLFAPCFLLLFFPKLFIKPLQAITLPFCISFSLGRFWSAPPVQCYESLSIALQVLCLSDPILWISLSSLLYDHKEFGLGYTWISSVQSFSHVQLFAIPWIAAHQASLSITNSWSSPKLMSIELVMPSNQLILCCPLVLLPLIFPSNRVFSSESALHISGQSIGVSASTSVLPMNTQEWFPLGWTGWISFQSKGLSRVFPNTTSALSFLYSPTLTSIHEYWKNHRLD